MTGTSFSSPLVAAAAAWVWTVRPRLEKTQLFELMRRSARDIGVPGVDNDSGYGLLDIPAALTRPELPIDPREPNDDVRYVKAGGISRTATPPLTTPRRSRARSPLASTRPRTRKTSTASGCLRGAPFASRPSAAQDVDLDIWRPTTASVLVEGAARRRFLLGSSTRRGSGAERVTVRNRTTRGYYAYADVYLRENGPDTAEYRLTIATAQR